MSENDTSSVWSQFRDAKKHALREQDAGEEEERMTLEQLEEAIAQLAATSGIPETGLPPRAVVHPSQNRQLNRWFYRILVVLFIALVAGLIWWGRKKYGQA